MAAKMNIHVLPHTRWCIPGEIGLVSVKVGKFGEGEHHMFACWQKRSASVPLVRCYNLQLLLLSILHCVHPTPLPTGRSP